MTVINTFPVRTRQLPARFNASAAAAVLSTVRGISLTGQAFRSRNAVVHNEDEKRGSIGCTAVAVASGRTVRPAISAGDSHDARFATWRCPVQRLAQFAATLAVGATAERWSHDCRVACKASCSGSGTATAPYHGTGGRDERLRHSSASKHQFNGLTRPYFSCQTPSAAPGKPGQPAAWAGNFACLCGLPSQHCHRCLRDSMELPH